MASPPGAANLAAVVGPQTSPPPLSRRQRRKARRVSSAATSGTESTPSPPSSAPSRFGGSSRPHRKGSRRGVFFGTGDLSSPSVGDVPKEATTEKQWGTTTTSPTVVVEVGTGISRRNVDIDVEAGGGTVVRWSCCATGGGGGGGAGDGSSRGPRALVVGGGGVDSDGSSRGPGALVDRGGDKGVVVCGTEIGEGQEEAGNRMDDCDVWTVTIVSDDKDEAPVVRQIPREGGGFCEEMFNRPGSFTYYVCSGPLTTGKIFAKAPTCRAQLGGTPAAAAATAEASPLSSSSSPFPSSPVSLNESGNGQPQGDGSIDENPTSPAEAGSAKSETTSTTPAGGDSSAFYGPQGETRSHSAQDERECVQSDTEVAGSPGEGQEHVVALKEDHAADRLKLAIGEDSPRVFDDAPASSVPGARACDRPLSEAVLLRFEEGSARGGARSVSSMPLSRREVPSGAESSCSDTITVGSCAEEERTSGPSAVIVLSSAPADRESGTLPSPPPLHVSPPDGAGPGRVSPTELSGKEGGEEAVGAGSSLREEEGPDSSKKPEEAGRPGREQVLDAEGGKEETLCISSASDTGDSTTPRTSSPASVQHSKGGGEELSRPPGAVDIELPTQELISDGGSGSQTAAFCGGVTATGSNDVSPPRSPPTSSAEEHAEEFLGGDVSGGRDGTVFCDEDSDDVCGGNPIDGGGGGDTTPRKDDERSGEEWKQKPSSPHSPLFPDPPPSAEDPTALSDASGGGGSCSFKEPRSPALSVRAEPTRYRRIKVSQRDDVGQDWQEVSPLGSPGGGSTGSSSAFISSEDAIVWPPPLRARRGRKGRDALGSAAAAAAAAAAAVVDEEKATAAGKVQDVVAPSPREERDEDDSEGTIQTGVQAVCVSEGANPDSVKAPRSLSPETTPSSAASVSASASLGDRGDGFDSSPKFSPGFQGGTGTAPASPADRDVARLPSCSMAGEGVSSPRDASNNCCFESDGTALYSAAGEKPEAMTCDPVGDVSPASTGALGGSSGGGGRESGADGSKHCFEFDRVSLSSPPKVERLEAERSEAVPCDPVEDVPPTTTGALGGGSGGGGDESGADGIRVMVVGEDPARKFEPALAKVPVGTRVMWKRTSGTPNDAKSETFFVRLGCPIVETGWQTEVSFSLSGAQPTFVHAFERAGTFVISSDGSPTAGADRKRGEIVVEGDADVSGSGSDSFASPDDAQAKLEGFASGNDGDTCTPEGGGDCGSGGDNSVLELSPSSSMVQSPSASPSASPSSVSGVRISPASEGTFVISSRRRAEIGVESDAAVSGSGSGSFSSPDDARAVSEGFASVDEGGICTPDSGGERGSRDDNSVSVLSPSSSVVRLPSAPPSSGLGDHIRPASDGTSVISSDGSQSTGANRKSGEIVVEGEAAVSSSGSDSFASPDDARTKSEGFASGNERDTCTPEGGGKRGSGGDNSVSVLSPSSCMVQLSSAPPSNVSGGRMSPANEGTFVVSSDGSPTARADRRRGEIGVESDAVVSDSVSYIFSSPDDSQTVSEGFASGDEGGPCMPDGGGERGSGDNNSVSVLSLSPSLVRLPSAPRSSGPGGRISPASKETLLISSDGSPTAGADMSRGEIVVEGDTAVSGSGSDSFASANDAQTVSEGFGSGNEGGTCTPEGGGEGGSVGDDSVSVLPLSSMVQSPSAPLSSGSDGRINPVSEDCGSDGKDLVALSPAVDDDFRGCSTASACIQDSSMGQRPLAPGVAPPPVTAPTAVTAARFLEPSSPVFTRRPRSLPPLSGMPVAQRRRGRRALSDGPEWLQSDRLDISEWSDASTATSATQGVSVATLSRQGSLSSRSFSDAPVSSASSMVGGQDVLLRGGSGGGGGGGGSSSSECSSTDAEVDTSRGVSVEVSTVAAPEAPRFHEDMRPGVALSDAFTGAPTASCTSGEQGEHEVPSGEAPQADGGVTLKEEEDKDAVAATFSSSAAAAATAVATTSAATAVATAAAAATVAAAAAGVSRSQDIEGVEHALTKTSLSKKKKSSRKKKKAGGGGGGGGGGASGGGDGSGSARGGSSETSRLGVAGGETSMLVDEKSFSKLYSEGVVAAATAAVGGGGGKTFTKTLIVGDQGFKPGKPVVVQAEATISIKTARVWPNGGIGQHRALSISLVGPVTQDLQARRFVEGSNKPEDMPDGSIFKKTGPSGEALVAIIRTPGEYWLVDHLAGKRIKVTASAQEAAPVGRVQLIRSGPGGGRYSDSIISSQDIRGVGTTAISSGVGAGGESGFRSKKRSKARDKSAATVATASALLADVAAVMSAAKVPAAMERPKVGVSVIVPESACGAEVYAVETLDGGDKGKNVNEEYFTPCSPERDGCEVGLQQKQGLLPPRLLPPIRIIRQDGALTLDDFAGYKSFNAVHVVKVSRRRGFEPSTLQTGFSPGLGALVVFELDPKQRVTRDMVCRLMAPDATNAEAVVAPSASEKMLNAVESGAEGTSSTTSPGVTADEDDRAEDGPTELCTRLGPECSHRCHFVLGRFGQYQLSYRNNSRKELIVVVKPPPMYETSLGTNTVSPLCKVTKYAAEAKSSVAKGNSHVKTPRGNSGLHFREEAGDEAGGQSSGEVFTEDGRSDSVATITDERNTTKPSSIVTSAEPVAKSRCPSDDSGYQTVQVEKEYLVRDSSGEGAAAAGASGSSSVVKEEISVDRDQNQGHGDFVQQKSYVKRSKRNKMKSERAEAAKTAAAAASKTAAAAAAVVAAKTAAAAAAATKVAVPAPPTVIDLSISTNAVVVDLPTESSAVESEANMPTAAGAIPDKAAAKGVQATTVSLAAGNPSMVESQNVAPVDEPGVSTKSNVGKLPVIVQAERSVEGVTVATTPPRASSAAAVGASASTEWGLPLEGASWSEGGSTVQPQARAEYSPRGWSASSRGAGAGLRPDAHQSRASSSAAPARRRDTALSASASFIQPRAPPRNFQPRGWNMPFAAGAVALPSSSWGGSSVVHSPGGTAEYHRSPGGVERGEKDMTNSRGKEPTRRSKLSSVPGVSPGGAPEAAVAVAPVAAAAGMVGIAERGENARNGGFTTSRTAAAKAGTIKASSRSSTVPRSEKTHSTMEVLEESVVDRLPRPHSVTGQAVVAAVEACASHPEGGGKTGMDGSSADSMCSSLETGAGTRSRMSSPNPPDPTSFPGTKLPNRPRKGSQRNIKVAHQSKMSAAAVPVAVSGAPSCNPVCSSVVKECNRIGRSQAASGTSETCSVDLRAVDKTEAVSRPSSLSISFGNFSPPVTGPTSKSSEGSGPSSPGERKPGKNLTVTGAGTKAGDKLPASSPQSTGGWGVVGLGGDGGNDADEVKTDSTSGVRDLHLCEASVEPPGLAGGDQSGVCGADAFAPVPMPQGLSTEPSGSGECSVHLPSSQAPTAAKEEIGAIEDPEILGATTIPGMKTSSPCSCTTAATPPEKSSGPADGSGKSRWGNCSTKVSFEERSRRSRAPLVCGADLGDRREEQVRARPAPFPKDSWQPGGGFLVPEDSGDRLPPPSAYEVQEAAYMMKVYEETMQRLQTGGMDEQLPNGFTPRIYDFTSG